MGIARGTKGGSVDTETELRSLGLTSLDMIKTGFDASSRWMAQAAKPPQFDFTQFMLTPQQRISLQQWNEQQRWGPEWLQNQMDALPKDWQRATKGLLDWVATMGENYLGMYAGSIGSGGTPGENKSSPAPNFSQMGSFMNMGGGGGGGGGMANFGMNSAGGAGAMADMDAYNWMEMYSY